MKYSIFDKPLKVYGIPHFEENRRLERLPAEHREKLNHPDTCDMIHHGTRTMGARVAFRTNAKKITVSMNFTAKLNEKIKLEVSDGINNITIYGAEPSEAIKFDAKPIASS